MLILISPTTAQGQESYCPKSITVKETVEKVPEGWTAGQDKTPKNLLAGITFYDGPPEQEASLVYDSWTKRNGLAYGVWHFDPNSSIWISCRYSATSVVLSKQLPAKTSKCDVTYDPKVTVDGYPELQKIACH
ncbi:MAG TPA: STY0301 family protein [Terriglobales bacterium]|nr:STY0301 family protein [Terriglobales bacterium]